VTHPSPTGVADGKRLVDGEFVFQAEDFRRIAAILHDSAGIALSESKATLVYSRLAKRLRSLGLESFRDYCALVASSGGADERQQMIAALTTNVPRFFREPHHFEHLKAHVLPPLLDAARRGGAVRLWSAGCSSGEEPYSMALTILSMAPEAADWDVRILATDIDTSVLQTAARGVYPIERIDGMDMARKRRFFQRGSGPNAGQCRVRPELQALIEFRPLNLLDADYGLRNRYTAVFCRNVMIYFDKPTQYRVLERIVPLLEPEGRLYAGHSESFHHAADVVSPCGRTVYRASIKRGER